MNRVLNKTKNHEFRTRIPNKNVDYIFVYIPVPIKELKYNFTAPQSFAYGEKYKELLEYIDKSGITKLY